MGNLATTLYDEATKDKGPAEFHYVRTDPPKPKEPYSPWSAERRAAASKAARERITAV